MKKFSVVFALFAAMIFVVSCGSGSSWDDESCRTIEGLLWSSLSSRHMIWEKAVDYCENLNECGHSDWRLPNINELRKLIRNCPGSESGGACVVSDPDYLSPNDWSYDCFCEYIDSSLNDWDDDHYQKFFREDGDVSLWSSSLVNDREQSAVWEVDFGSGGVYDQNDESQLFVRCVINAD